MRLLSFPYNLSSGIQRRKKGNPNMQRIGTGDYVLGLVRNDTCAKVVATDGAHRSADVLVGGSG